MKTIELWSLCCGRKNKLLGVGETEEEAVYNSRKEIYNIQSRGGTFFSEEDNIFDYIKNAVCDYRFNEIEEEEL